jgi:hypothetical protein
MSAMDWTDRDEQMIKGQQERLVKSPTVEKNSTAGMIGFSQVSVWQNIAAVRWVVRIPRHIPALGLWRISNESTRRDSKLRGRLFYQIEGGSY